MVAFVLVAVVVSNPNWLEVLRGLIPTIPGEPQPWVAEKYPEIAAKPMSLEIIAYLGDNLNDFSRRYYVTGVEERRRLATQDADTYGHSRILFPNNTDGHWMRAIFGDSEPLDTPEYRARMLAAAKGLVP